MPTSVGFGPTKTLAKLANHVAKTPDRKPGSYPRQLAQVCDFGSLGSEALDEVMRRTDVGNTWGVGRKTAPKLHEAGIRTVLDLRRADAATLGRRFSYLMATLDALNERFGRDAVGIASGVRKTARSTHSARQERRAPLYTTRLDEVLVAKA